METRKRIRGKRENEYSRGQGGGKRRQNKGNRTRKGMAERRCEGRSRLWMDEVRGKSKMSEGRIGIRGKTGEGRSRRGGERTGEGGDEWGERRRTGRERGW